MHARLGEPLPDDPRSFCTNCGERTSLVRQPNGTKVALSDAPGSYVIRNSVAYRSGTNAGYARHSDVCTHRLSAMLIDDPKAAEFLWGKECGS
jgi:hypothetical protein